MRVIGIDPGIERTGFAVLEITKGSSQLLDCGRILTDKKQAFGNRLQTLAYDLRSILRKWKPEAAAIEQIFFSKNVKTAMKVSHARGVILEILKEYGVEVQELNPAHVKMSVTGSGRADKLQMKKMIGYLLKRNIPYDDTVDAIACGLSLTYNL